MPRDLPTAIYLSEDLLPRAVDRELFIEELPFTDATTPIFREASGSGEPGSIWDVTLIRAGMSLNRRRYPESTLRAAANLFEGASACADHPTTDELAARGGSRSVREIVGYYTGVQYNESARAIEGQLHILPQQAWLRDILTEMSKPGTPKLVGLSIAAKGEAQNVTEAGQTFPEITRLSSVISCDVVTQPAAGGGILRLVADSTAQDDLSQSTLNEDVTCPLCATRNAVSSKTCTSCGAGLRTSGSTTTTTYAYPAESATHPQEALMNREQVRALLEGRSPEERARWLTAFGMTEAQLMEGVTPSPATPAGPTAVQVVPLATPAAVAVIDPPATGTPTATPVVEGVIPTAPVTSPANPTPSVTTPPPVNPSFAEAQAEMVALRAMFEANARDMLGSYANSKITDLSLPEHIHNNLVTRMNKLFERRTPEKVEIDYMCSEAKDMWAAFEQHTGSGAVKGMPGSPLHGPGGISLGNNGVDQTVAAIDGMLANEDVKLGDRVIPRFKSFKQAYCGYTGKNPWDINPYEIMSESANSSYDAAIGGRISETTGKPMIFESMNSASWANVLSDRMYRRMVQAYKLMGLDDWRKLVSNIETVTDFRLQRRERIGGYGTLPIVAEGATYQFLNSPSDEEASYAIQKRGGLEVITFEMVQNDDLQNIRKIPTNLARAAAMTLYRFVMDMVKDVTTPIYDGNPLYYASHNNLITGNPTLSDSGLATAWQQMRSQQPFGSTTEYLGMSAKPRYLLIPNTLEQLAWKLTNSDVSILSSNFNATEPNFFKGRGIEPIIVDYWSDVNNWVLMADPSSVPTIEMGFFNGQEDPEMFVQDQPNVGSVMTSDKITYKIRHIYSGVVLDWRGMAISQP